MNINNIKYLIILSILIILISFASAAFVDNSSLSQVAYDCGNLNTSNAVYTMNQSANTNGTCFNILASNITLNCNGQMINYSSGLAGFGYGINVTNKNNVTVINCIIIDGIDTVNYKYSIYLYNSSNGIIQNNTITLRGNNGNSLILSSNSSYNNIINNFLNTTGNGSIGISIYSNSDSNTLLNNTIITTGGVSFGIFLNSSRYDILNNNNVNSSRANSYLVNGTSLDYLNHSIDSSNLAEGKPVNYTLNVDNLIFNNVDFTQYGQVIFAYSRNITISNSNFSNDGLSLFYTNTSTINNNLFITSKGSSILLNHLSSFNNIFNNTILSGLNQMFAVWLYYGTNYNNITNNNITTNGALGSYGLGIYVSNYNNISENIISSLGRGYAGHALYNYFSTYNNISKNTITTTASYGYGISLSTNSNYTNVFNNTINTNESYAYGVVLTTNVNYNNISNNTIRTNATYAYGVLINVNSNYNNISNNTISTFGTYAAATYINSAYYNNLTNNRITTYASSGFGLYLYISGNSNTFSYNNVKTYSSNSWAVYIQVSSSNNILNNEINSSSTGVYALSSCSYNNISNNNIYTTGASSPGISFASGVISYSTAFNNTIKTIGSSSYGIYVAPTSGADNISNNIITTTNSYAHGIYSDSSNSNIIINNTINTTGYNTLAIYLITSNLTNVFNNRITTSNGVSYGIYLSTSNLGNVVNNTINTTGYASIGIAFSASSSNNVSNNSITTTGGYAYDIWSSNNKFNNFSNNNMNSSNALSFNFYAPDINGTNHSIDSSNLVEGKPINYTFNADNLTFSNINFSSYGQVIFANSRNITISNCSFYDDGLSFFYTNFSTIVNTTINTSNGFALTIGSNSNNNNISDVIIATSGGYQIGLYFSINLSNNNVSNVSITTLGNLAQGIYINGPSNNYFSRMRVSVGGSAEALFITGANNNFAMFDSFLNGGSDIYLTTSVNQGEFNFTNVTKSNGSLNYINWSANANATLNRIWYVNISAVNFSRVALSNANISIYDRNNISIFSENTASDGSTTKNTVLEFKRANNTLTYYTPHTINVTKTEYRTNSTTYNLTSLRNINFALILTENTLPTITFEAPTPDNNSKININPAIVANISDNFDAATSSWIDFDRSLIGYWSMDYYNATGIFDNSTYNNFGIFAPGTGLNYSNMTIGARGYGLSFDGADDYMLVSKPSSLSNFNELTVSLWMNPNSFKNYTGFISERNGTSGFSTFNMGFSTNSSTIRMDVWNSTNSLNTSFYTLSSGDFMNKWTNMIGIYNGTHILIYVNGILVTSRINLIGNLRGNLSIRIGCDQYDCINRDFNGSLDEVMIFNRTLSGTEVSALYNSQSNKFDATFSGLLQGNHSYTVYALDSSGNINNSQQKNIFLDSINPNLTLNPLNNTYTTNTTINLSANLTDFGSGITNATLNLYNSTDFLINTTTSNFTNGTSSGTISLLVNLFDGAYKWFVSLFDLVGNQNIDLNNTLIIDTIYPLITFKSDTPQNNSIVSEMFNVNVSITELNLANITWNWNGETTTIDTSNENLTNTEGGTWILTFNQTGLGVGSSYYYNLSVMDYAGNFNSTETRIVKGNIKPAFISVANSPDYLGELDPGVEVVVTSNISDVDINLDEIIFQWKNQSADWSEAENIPMNNISVSADGIYTIVNASFIPSYESNYSYRIWANDSTSDVNISSIVNISVYWDCSWNLSTYSIGETSGFYIDKNLGSFEIQNTGDSNYLGGCLIGFNNNYIGNSFSGDYYTSNFLSNTRVSFSPSILSLLAGESSIIEVYGGFPDSADVLLEKPILKITSNFTDTIDSGVNRYINATMIIVSGASLFQEVEEPSSSLVNIELTNASINWVSYVRNLGGDGSSNNSAYNVSFNWTLPSYLSDKINSGSTESFYENLSNFSRQYNNLTLELTKDNLERDSLPINTPISVYIYSYGYENTTGNLSLILNSQENGLFKDSFNVTFLCKNESDGIIIPSCGSSDGDYVAPVTTVIVNSGGGGGGGGVGGASTNLYEKSEATVELVRGGDLEFKLNIENKLNIPKENINITVSGLNSEYMELVPSQIDRLNKNSSKEVVVKISAPKYFNYGKYLLSFNIKGEIINNDTRIPFTEDKYITLYIVELKRDAAIGLINNSQDIILEMNNFGMKVEKLEEILVNMDESLGSYDYGNLKLEYDNLKIIYDSALQSKEILSELDKGIKKAKSKGIDVSETQKLLFIAEVAYERGDYVLALQRLQEAKLSYALEVKGEFNFIYQVKSNPLESLGILIGFSLFGFGTSLVTKKVLYKKKIKLLEDEEKLLLELMKVVQRDCFERNKMSMEQYQEAMHQYENKLSETIQDKIKFETKLANLMNLKNKRDILNEEREKLVIMMKKLQNDYLKEGKVETRIYENMMKSYASRLSDVEENIVFLDAKESLRRRGFFRRMFRK